MNLSMESDEVLVDASDAPHILPDTPARIVHDIKTEQCSMRTAIDRINALIYGYKNAFKIQKARQPNGR